LTRAEGKRRLLPGRFNQHRAQAVPTWARENPGAAVAAPGLKPKSQSRWIAYWRWRLEQLCPQRNRLVRYAQGHMALFIEEARHQAFRHERADLLGREIDDCNYLLAY